MSASADNCEPIEKRVKSNSLCEENETNSVISKPSENIELVDNEETISNNEDDDNDSFTFPPDDNVKDMLEEVEYHGTFPSITSRYFTAYYKLNVQSFADDICVLVHSNRICMLTLAPSHAVLQSGKQITKVDFKVSDKVDRTLNKVSGKSKHGAQPLQTNSNICTVSCSSGETYTIKCCIIGKLVEVNEQLVENPELLLQPPHNGGYLAIVLPNIKLLEQMKKNLLTQEQYELAISKRENDKTNLEDLKMEKDNHASDVPLPKPVDTGEQLTTGNSDKIVLAAVR